LTAVWCGSTAMERGQTERTCVERKERQDRVTTRETGKVKSSHPDEQDNIEKQNKDTEKKAWAAFLLWCHTRGKVPG
jgi:hypothetical protein